MIASCTHASATAAGRRQGRRGEAGGGGGGVGVESRRSQASQHDMPTGSPHRRLRGRPSSSLSDPPLGLPRPSTPTPVAPVTAPHRRRRCSRARVPVARMTAASAARSAAPPSAPLHAPRLPPVPPPSAPPPAPPSPRRPLLRRPLLRRPLLRHLRLRPPERLRLRQQCLRSRLNPPARRAWLRLHRCALPQPGVSRRATKPAPPRPAAAATLLSSPALRSSPAASPPHPCPDPTAATMARVMVVPARALRVGGPQPPPVTLRRPPPPPPLLPPSSPPPGPRSTTATKDPRPRRRRVEARVHPSPRAPSPPASARQDARAVRLAPALRARCRWPRRPTLPQGRVPSAARQFRLVATSWSDCRGEVAVPARSRGYQGRSWEGHGAIDMGGHERPWEAMGGHGRPWEAMGRTWEEHGEA